MYPIKGYYQTFQWSARWKIVQYTINFIWSWAVYLWILCFYVFCELLIVYFFCLLTNDSRSFIARVYVESIFPNLSFVFLTLGHTEMFSAYIVWFINRFPVWRLSAMFREDIFKNFKNSPIFSLFLKSKGASYSILKPWSNWCMFVFVRLKGGRKAALFFSVCLASCTIFIT